MSPLTFPQIEAIPGLEVTEIEVQLIVLGASEPLTPPNPLPNAV